jgi:hypothetical protein
MQSDSNHVFVIDIDGTGIIRPGDFKKAGLPELETAKDVENPYIAAVNRLTAWTLKRVQEGGTKIMGLV